MSVAPFSRFPLFSRFSRVLLTLPIFPDKLGLEDVGAASPLGSIQTDYGIIKTIGGCRVHLQPARRDPDLERLMALKAADLRELPDATVVSEGRHGFVLRIRRGRDLPTIYWKEFGPRNWYDPLKDRVRGSKARRAWQGSLKLQRIGIFTARLIAYGEEPVEGIFKHARSFLVTEEIEDAQSVDDFLRAFPNDPNPERIEQKRGLMHALGHTVGRIHQADLYHSDLRLENIMWRPGASGRPRLYFIDTDRVLQSIAITDREIVKNLMQVNWFFLPGLTLTDRARILASYADERLFDDDARTRYGGMIFDRLRQRVERTLARSGEDAKADPVKQGMLDLLRTLMPPKRMLVEQGKAG